MRFRFPGHGHPTAAFGEGIPDGWEIRALGDLAEVNRLTLRAKDLPDPLRYLDISALGPRRLGDAVVIEAAAAPGRARRRVADGDTLWATVRPNRRAHALIHNPPDDLVVSNGVVSLTAISVPSSFLFEYASFPQFTEHLVNRATGSAYPAVRSVDFEEAPIVLPPEALMKEFDAVADPALRMVSALAAENRALARTRDLLVPRLVTGRLDISDIDLGDLLPEVAAA